MCGPGAAVGAAVGAADGGGAADVACAVVDGGADVLGGCELGTPMQPVNTSGSRHIAVRLIVACMSMTPPGVGRLVCY